MLKNSKKISGNQGNDDFFQPPKVVLFLEYSSAAAYEVSAVRDVAPGKLSRKCTEIPINHEFVVFSSTIYTI